MGVLRLAQEGKLDLYTDINNYLTGWKFPYDSLSKGKKITVANLLSHTAGLTVDGFPGYAAGDSLPELINSVATVYKWKGFYEPQIKTVVTLDPTRLTACEGKYRSRDGKPLYVRIKAEKDRLLFTPSWVGQGQELFPDSPDSFFSADNGLPVKLIKGQDGSVKSILANDRDYRDKVPQ